MICGNCDDFDSVANVCTIRNLIHADKTRESLPVKPERPGCKVFMFKVEPRKEESCSEK